jgi:hypothetical protein
MAGSQLCGIFRRADCLMTLNISFSKRASAMSMSRWSFA